MVGGDDLCLPISIDALLVWGRRTLKTGGVSEAASDAKALLLFACALSPEALISEGRMDADQPAVKAYRDAIVRRVSGEPVAHITGRAPFYCRDWISDSRALVPRADS